MRHLVRRFAGTAAFLVGAAAMQPAGAQDVADPLTIQGLDRFGYMSAKARAMGGTIVAVGDNVGAMFANPATLTQLERPEVRVGAFFSSSKYQQHQHWVPNRFYTNLSLICEDLTDGIKQPEPLPPNPADRVQTPYDDIGPHWTTSTSSMRPSLAALGVPFAVGNVRVAAAVGFSDVVNLDTYFQNNNALSPNIGTYRPEPTPVVTGTDSLKVQWYQFSRQRTGTISGVTPALSVEPAKGLSVGGSATLLFGSSDDYEYRVERGLLTFFYDKFRLDSVYNHVSRAGTSTYSGVLPTIGALFQQETFTLGVSVRLPVTITRDWDRTVQTDTGGVLTTVMESGSDKLKVPVCLTLGGVLHPSPQVDVSIDYDIRQYGDVQYTPSTGSTVNPWLNSQTVRAGVEYRAMPWLALRGGYRQVAASFAAAGAALMDEPATGTAYTAGVGLNIADASFDLSYEYTHIGYEDAWQSNVNFNKIYRHSLWLETGFRF